MFKLIHVVWVLGLVRASLASQTFTRLKEPKAMEPKNISNTTNDINHLLIEDWINSTRSRTRYSAAFKVQTLLCDVHVHVEARSLIVLCLVPVPYRSATTARACSGHLGIRHDL